mgnify:CR=1 FL=1
MFKDLFSYFREEISFKDEKKELDEENKIRNRYMYFFAILFIILLVCSFLNII